MRCFPLLLIRIAGLPKDSLKPLEWKATALLDEILRFPQQLTEGKTRLLQQLEQLADQITDPQLRKQLTFLQKDFQQNDRLRTGKLIRLFPEQPLLQQQLEAYLQLKEVGQELEWQFEQAYAGQVLEERKGIQALSQDPRLLNGLLFSSISLLNRIADFQQRAALDFRKKERQTLLSLLQFLSRMIHKTSPFSSFCGVDLIDLDQREQSPPGRLLRFNNYLWAHFQERLEEWPAAYRQLSLRRNPSLEEASSVLRFLLNARNAESIQQLDSDELLEFVLKLSKDSIVFQDLLKQLLLEVEAEAEELEQWLIQLIQAGLLEWDWPLAQGPQRLMALLKSIPQEEERSKILLAQINQLNQYRAAFEQANIPERKQLLDILSVTLDEFNALWPKPSVQAPSAQHFQKFTSHALELAREKFLYEDVRQVSDLKITKAELQPFIDSLEELAVQLRPIQYSKINDQIEYCFKTHFPNAKKVGVLDFYQAYHQCDFPENSTEKKRVHELRQHWKQILPQFLQLEADGCLRLDLDRFKSLPTTPTEVKIEWAEAKATLLQIAQNQHGWKAYTDACITAYGKHYGRFLPLFDSAFTAQIRRDNQEALDDLALELCDHSFFNANEHPPLMPYELLSSNSQNQLPLDQQIPLKEIQLYRPSFDAPLQLVHGSTGQRILPFDLGIEALSSRSPMYRLLSAFGPAVPSISEFKVLLNDLFGQQKAGLIFFPRIELNQHLMLQRKHWYIPSDQLPMPQKGESDAAYFLRVQDWHHMHFPSPKVFLTFHPRNIQFEGQVKEEEGRGERDDYKPQYFNLGSPSFVQLFGKKVKGCRAFLKVEEQWPLTEEVPGEHVQEVLLQWRN